jgi:hypothetical protein
MFRYNFVEYGGQVRSNDSLFVHPICFIALRGGGIFRMDFVLDGIRGVGNG